MLVESITTFIIILAGVWFITEVLQAIWYESVVTNLLPRVLIASIIFTAVQLFSHLRFENLFAEGLPYLIGSGIVWVTLFWLGFQFAPNHALGLGISAMLLLTCLAGLVSDGFTDVRTTASTRKNRGPAKAIRIPRYTTNVVPFQLPGQEKMTTTKADGKADGKADDAKPQPDQKKN